MAKFVLKIPEVEGSISPIEQTKMSLIETKTHVQTSVKKMTEDGWEGEAAESFMGKTSEWLSSIESLIDDITTLNRILTNELLPPSNASNTEALAFPTYFDNGSGSGCVNTLTLEPSAKDTALSCCKSMTELYEDSLQSLAEIKSGLGELHNPFTPSPSISKLSKEINENIEKVSDFSSALNSYAVGVNSFDNSVASSLAQFNMPPGWTAIDVQVAIQELKGIFVLPDEFEKQIQDIKNDDSLSAIEKTDKIVAVYENYLYLQHKDAFDEYDRVRLKYKDPQERKKSQEFNEAEKKLAEILQNSNIDIKAVARSMGNHAIEVSGVNSMDYMQFINMVDTGKPLDLKSREIGSSKYSIWSRGWSQTIFKKPDYLGNYLFGYYGEGTMLLKNETLVMGAGIAQIWSDKDWVAIAGYSIGLTTFPKLTAVIWAINGYGDNDGDGEMIRDGIQDFEKYSQY